MSGYKCYFVSSMKAAELSLYPQNNPSYRGSIRSILGISKQGEYYLVTHIATMYFQFLVQLCSYIKYLILIVLTDEWKRQLATYLIDYDSLDIKETIASGL